MSRIAFVIGVIIVIIGSYFLVQFMKKSYWILPVDEQQVEQVEKTDYTTWMQFSPEDQNFQVKLPSPPENADKNVKDPETGSIRHYDMYVTQGLDGTIYMINKITIPPEEANEEGGALLKEVMNDMVDANPQNKLLGIDEGKDGGNPTLEFTIESQDSRFNTYAFMEGNILYVLTRAAAAGDERKDDFTYFINSFQLRNQ